MNSTSGTEYNEYENYENNENYSNHTVIPPVAQPLCTDVMCVLLAIAYAIIVILGITGNGFVIWITGFKIKKTVNTVWYLSLAVSDFLFCATLPFSIVYLIKRDWVFGRFMCKFTSFILFLNMFSSIFLLLIISVDRCIVVMFPVWAQNKRSISRASVMVVLAWIISAGFSMPAAIFRAVEKEHSKQTFCFYRYISDKEHIAIGACRFIFGFIIPFLIIIICYFLIIRKLKTNLMAKSTKPFKVMTALIAVFFICWLPYHIFNLLEVNLKFASVIPIGQKISTTLASANSFLNPFLYAFMGKDFKSTCYSLLPKIESALEEEGRSSVRGTSFSNLVATV